ncbi:hypothetical protein FRE64_16910 (plasmid) [Euhalothece natronophila Z-M001]|uniref:Uncharacterized protein n=1 Tax=Euhalothece natronophila Z-M001 TaxID=522448 RepID=A0A5B8NQP8_9CHRO|nr:hypothetical protein [Euhalothece natronophila]QDZ41653.1 hypothetical protein FRE64_16910 [Euhalothece natronophila Z-M001]
MIAFTFQNNQATAAQPSSLLPFDQQERRKRNPSQLLLTAHGKVFYQLDLGIPPDRGRRLIPLLQAQMMGGEANG